MIPKVEMEEEEELNDEVNENAFDDRLNEYLKDESFQHVSNINPAYFKRARRGLNSRDRSSAVSPSNMAEEGEINLSVVKEDASLHWMTMRQEQMMRHEELPPLGTFDASMVDFDPLKEYLVQSQKPEVKIQEEQEEEEEDWDFKDVKAKARLLRKQARERAILYRMHKRDAIKDPLKRLRNFYRSAYKDLVEIRTPSDFLTESRASSPRKSDVEAKKNEDEGKNKKSMKPGKVVYQWEHEALDRVLPNIGKKDAPEKISFEVNKNAIPAAIVAERARVASRLMQSATTEQKSNALKAIHHGLSTFDLKELEEANLEDLKDAKAQASAGTLSESLVKRLDLGVGKDKFQSLIQGVLDVGKLDDPVGKVTLGTKLDDCLELYRVSCPIGVLLIIFEARPEVVVQITCLSIKSGNAVILKGGKEARRTNRKLYEIIRKSLATLPEGQGIPQDAVQLIESREDIDDLLKLDRYIDLVIPRGSNQLVRHIQNNTRIPVLGHADGLCSIYLDASATQEKAVKVIVDAKTSYPAACNSTETLLIHTATLSTLFPSVALALLESKVKLKLDDASYGALTKLDAVKPYIEKGFIEAANDEDFSTEFLTLTIAVKTVSGLKEAVEHINVHGSHHTDAIVTEDKDAAEFFMSNVDAAGVFWNASTRFADGFRYGFGAEIGVSTNKTHARGPVGLEGLVIYKYRIYGDGQASQDYGSDGNKRKYLHEALPQPGERLEQLKKK
ncbi:hypothetical protein HDU96_003216 [Phlyctochytrium bullatum]|nr:hypothetical protein HDU96_003216 [Phlyctochytrium bullatum]